LISNNTDNGFLVCFNFFASCLAKRRLSTESIVSKIWSALLILLVCRWPIILLVYPSSGSIALNFLTASCTRFSPISIMPLRMHISTVFWFRDFVAATIVTLSTRLHFFRAESILSLTRLILSSRFMPYRYHFFSSSTFFQQWGFLHFFLRERLRFCHYFPLDPLR